MQKSIGANYLGTKQVVSEEIQLQKEENNQTDKTNFPLLKMIICIVIIIIIGLAIFMVYRWGKE